MASPRSSLDEYNRKRDFSKTREPKGEPNRKANGGFRYLVQKHDATRLHYDFRLEWDGVLKSWAVTKGPSVNPDDKRLAVRTEDHPMAYGDFEGTIPEKQYGGGTVMLWDTGRWDPVGDPDEGLKEGKLKFRLHGRRLTGGWTLVRMRPRQGEKGENWLLIKEQDDAAMEDGDGVLEGNLTSVVSGRTMGEIAEGKGERKKRVWQSSTSAAENVRRGAIAPRKDRVSGKARGTGAKLPAFMPPQLATLVSTPPAGDDWVAEVKFDGYRLMSSIAGGKAVCFTRTGLDWTEKFADIAAALAGLNCESALIDGEAVAANDEGSTFSALQKALKHGGRIVLYAFDLLSLDGEDLTGSPLVERKDALRDLLAGGDGSIVKFSEHVRGHATDVFRSMCRAGQEGIIAKRAGDPYRSGRVGSWLKVKCTRRQEFVIGGYSPSDKKNRPFASLLLGTFEGDRLVYRGRVGTGFDERTMEELAGLFAKRRRKASPFAAVPPEFSHDAVWLKPDLVTEIDFAEFTDDGHIRHGSFEGLRRDKEARSVVLEQEKKTAEIVADATNTVEGKSSGEKAAAKRKGTDVTERSTGDRVAGIAITHPERVLFKEENIRKIDLARYYSAVSGRLLEHAGGHPVSLIRCPGGDIEHCFFQKHASDGFPEEIDQVAITESSGKTENYMMITDEKGLVAAVQMGTMEFHIWGASAARLETPDRLVFDLDPDAGIGFSEVRAAALELRDVLDAVGLRTVPLLTGGKGIHVIVPLAPKAEWEAVKTFAKGLAQRLADASPDRYVATMSKAKRKGRIFIDWLRNERGATAVAPYSVRARRGAPVATPVTWEELADIEAANAFGMSEVLARIESADPWAPARKWKQSLTDAMVKAVG
ncbi:DNA ligase D [Sinorhizobium sp. BG8]|uniref:DNA ligase D n=1 Tax=Sinorhizobium sp. BG8 TaxID=2613773 RepID=UPI00193E9060|nr:DNA ligase D [Sinorhizobium sp. BG8]QRM56591.1 DNA ligase D [Sinorhizobium sp. BG8]